MTLRLKLPSMWILRAWDGTIFSGWGCEPLAVQLSWVSGIVMNLALSLYLVLSFNWEERGCLRHNFPRFWFTSNHVGPRHSLIIRACKGLRFPVSIWKLLSSTVLRIYLHFFFLRHNGLHSPNCTLSLEPSTLEGNSDFTFLISPTWRQLAMLWLESPRT